MRYKTIVIAIIAAVSCQLSAVGIVEAASKGNPPVAHWRFDEGGGATAYDESANSNDGTLTPGAGGTNTAAGQMWTRQGKIGAALECDGTDDYVVKTSPTNIPSGQSARTISLWIKPTNVDPGGVLVALNNSAGTSQSFILEMGVSGGTTYLFTDGINGNNNVTISGSEIPSAGSWHHIDFVFNGTSTWTYYLDGVQKKTGSFVTTINTVINNVEIGRRGDGSSTGYYFPGLIDDVRIYNYARTADQVMVDYNAGASAHLGAGTDPNEGNPPIAYWPLDENTGTTAYDRAGSNYNLSFTNTPTWIQGKNGPALDFDNDDYASSDWTDFSLVNQTIEFWMRADSINASYRDLVGTTLNADSNRFHLLSTSNAIAWYSSVGTGPTVSSGITPAIGRWYHVAGTYDGTTVKIYIDGVLKNSAGASVVSYTATGIFIGGTSEDFDGQIDDVKIYNYARSASQIAYDYNRGKPVAQYKFDESGGAIAHNEYSTADTGADPVGWWRMDNNWNDSSGNTYNGTAGGNAAFDASGKIGPYTGTFDGTGDFVRLPSGSQWQFTGDFSVEMWIYPTDTDAGNLIGDYYIGGTTTPPDWQLTYGGTNQSIGFWRGSSIANTPANSAPRSTWHHITMTRSGLGSNNIHIYINGVESATGTFATTIGRGLNLWIGTDGNEAAESYLGKIDDVRIYNYARTPEQIYNDYKTTHGTLVGDTKFVDGKMGKALTFDGTGDYVDCGNDTSLNITGPITISAWVNYAGSGDCDAVCKIKVSNGYGPYSMAFKNSSQTFVESGDGTSWGTLISVSNTYSAGWHHVVATNDGTTAKLYVDGVLIGSDNSPVTSKEVISEHTMIGWYDGAAYNRYFNGKIDDVRIYNYARTADQILQDYNAGSARLGAQSAGESDPWGGAMPVNWWKMDENTGVLAKDASGNGNSGTITSAVWAQGKAGTGLSFGGAGYVTGSLTGISSTKRWTITTWFKTSDTQAYLFDTRTSEANGIGVYTPAANTLDAFMLIGGTVKKDYAYSLTSTDNNWHHLVLERDGDNSFSLYLDGIYRAPASTNTNLDITADSETWSTFTLGNRHTLNAYQLEGLLDDVKIYNYARTQAQVAWDYNRGKPTGHWKMDEATSGSAVGSGTIKDDSGRGNNGTGSGSNLAWTTGKFGGALSFNGTNDLVNCGQVLNTNQTLPFTMSAWANQTEASSWRTIIGTANSYAEIAVSGGTVEFGQNGGGGWFMGAGTISTGTWNHIVGVYDGTNASVYVNGVLKAGPTAHTFTATHGVTLIGSYHPSGGELFSGKIDDARVYNYARTAEQIQQDYLNGAAARLSD